MKTNISFVLACALLGVSLPSFAVDCNALRLSRAECKLYQTDQGFKSHIDKKIRFFKAERDPLTQQNITSSTSLVVRINNCYKAHCWDTKGNAYTKLSGRLYQHDNLVCRKIGAQLHCN